MPLGHPAGPGRPRVAVVIPCHDDGRFLADAIGSLADQEPCELVVVDDGSTDPGTLDALARLSEPGALVIRQGNQGLAAARMTGVRAASAPLVQMLDADDRLAPGALTALADALGADPGAQAAWGDVRSFGATERVYPKARALDPWRITFVDELPGTAMFRRADLLALGGWTLREAWEDWDLWMAAAERGWRGVRVPLVTLHYREHHAPRMYAASRARHDELRTLLRRRHPRLFAARRRNRRRSPAAWPVKFGFTAIDRAPFLSGPRKEALWVLLRNRLEPWMRPEGYPTLGRLIRDRVVGR